MCQIIKGSFSAVPKPFFANKSFILVLNDVFKIFKICALLYRSKLKMFTIFKRKLAIVVKIQQKQRYKYYEIQLDYSLYLENAPKMNGYLENYVPIKPTTESSKF